MRGLLLYSGAQGRAPCAERQVARRNFVGWAKALARRLSTARTLVRRAHHELRDSCRFRWWAWRTTVFAACKGRANAFAHPTSQALELPAQPGIKGARRAGADRARIGEAEERDGVDLEEPARRVVALIEHIADLAKNFDL